MSKDKDYDLKRNGDGYLDPTAYKAIVNADMEAERFRKLIGAIVRVCDLSDFHLEERIVVRDKRTGKVWR